MVCELQDMENSEEIRSDESLEKKKHSKVSGVDGTAVDFIKKG